MKSLTQLNALARKQGKATFWTWQEAKRKGVDPATLIEEERQQEVQFQAERREYEQYLQRKSNVSGGLGKD